MMPLFVLRACEKLWSCLAFDKEIGVAHSKHLLCHVLTCALLTSLLVYHCGRWVNGVEHSKRFVAMPCVCRVCGVSKRCACGARPPALLPRSLQEQSVVA